jgi:hypothetical protein
MRRASRRGLLWIDSVIPGLLLLVAGPSFAQRGSADPETAIPRALCDDKARQAGEAVAEFLKKVYREPPRNHWPEFRSLWKEYDGCDDGSIAEEFSSAATRLLKIEWAEAQIALLHDGVFRAFVLRHVDATEDEADILAVRHNASKKCKTGNTQKRLCAQVVDACDKALKEQRSSGTR